MKIIALRILLIAAILGLWQFSSAAPFGGGSNLQVYFGSPTAIGQALWENRLMLLSDTGVTCAEALLGFVIGALTGVFAAVLFARFRTLDLVVEPIFQALNSIPRPALAPLLIIWFGLGMTSKVAVAWSIVFFIMFYNVYAGVKAIDPDYVKSIRLLGASSRQITRIVIAPAIISWVFAALRLCVTYSLLGAVVGEYVGATNGLGYRLIVAEGLMQTNLLYGIIFILMLLGYALSTITKHVESWLLRWRPPAAAI